ncbi:MAG TPA: RagB/SusD family nutrient uptake outer membrane protein, partial [Anseongella sp.]|nr:RagB/SusD family nutrient uptake outer membrane protein [Anseongella sp.]
PLFREVIASRPHLTTLAFTDNFDITRENGPESIFAVQHAVAADGTGGENGNVGDMLNFPMGPGSPASCCGFLRPSIDLASAYRVGPDGLPMFETYRQTPVKSDLGLTGAAKENYKPDGNLRIDPRMDYTLGRRGVPYRDWGVFAGDAWIRGGSYAGPFMSYKNTIESSQISTGTAPGANHLTGLNVNVIRLADVYLMAAECEVEAGSLESARELVNAVRERASLTLAPKEVDGVPVADYAVGPYTVPFTDQAYARRAVRWERRLELAMEGHRFFDLVRWGVLKEVLESYYDFEGAYVSYLQGLTIQPQDEYFPIPQDEIDRSDGVLEQNEGY